MGNGFQVDLGELGRLTTTLDQAADDMRGANDQLRDAAARDLGSRAIAEMFPNPGPGHQGPTDCGWGNATAPAAQDLSAGESSITQALSGE